MASSKLSITFGLTQTLDARKVFRISAVLRAELKRAAELVAQTELPDISLDLSIVAMSDGELLAINRASLGHDYLTDVITFELERTKTAIESELYISVERALENARRFKRMAEEEIVHLVIHGVLHLAGYMDKTPPERKQMRKRERWYLATFQK